MGEVEIYLNGILELNNFLSQKLRFLGHFLKVLGVGVLIMDIKLLKHQTKKGSKVNLHANLIEKCMPLNVEMSKSYTY